MDSKRLNVVERISIITTKGFIENWNLPVCPNLITFSFRDQRFITDRNNPPTLSTTFQSLKRLRVLDLSYATTLHLLSPEIGELINLEFPNISGTYVDHLPNELKKLRILKVFLMDDMQLYYVKVIQFKVIESLEQLKVFRYSRHEVNWPTVKGEISLLEKLESLPNLEELSIQLTSFTSVQRLFHSTKLRDCSRHLRLSWKKNPTKPLEMSSLLGSMSERSHLEYIHLSTILSLVDGSSSVPEKFHLGKLRQVCIHVRSSITHLTWLSYAPLLKYLVVIDCSSIEHVVKEAKDDEEVGSKPKNENVFSNLKEFCLANMPKLVSIHQRTLAFPSLKRIVVSHCPNLKKLPFNSNFASNNNLVEIHGEAEWWDSLEWDDTIIEHLLRPKFKKWCLE